MCSICVVPPDSAKNRGVMSRSPQAFTVVCNHRRLEGTNVYVYTVHINGVVCVCLWSRKAIILILYTTRTILGCQCIQKTNQRGVKQKIKKELQKR